MIASADGVSLELASNLDALAAVALKYGPFVFSMLFLLVIVGSASRMYIGYLRQFQTQNFDYRGLPYLLFLVGSICFSFWLVWYSVEWWETKQRDLYAFSFEVDAVPKDGNIEICHVKRVFYRDEPTNIDKYRNYTMVILLDDEINKGYMIKMKYTQKQMPNSSQTVSTGCNLLVSYPGRSGTTYLLPSDLPNGPNDTPKQLDAEE